MEEGVTYCCPRKESVVRRWGSGFCSSKILRTHLPCLSVSKASELLPFALTLFERS